MSASASSRWELLFNPANQIVLVQPPSGPPTTSSWDPNGNLLLENNGGAFTSYTWDPDDRLVNLALPTGAYEANQYSQDGLRKSQTTDSGTTLFTWDEQNVLLETNTSFVIQARYTDYPGYWGGIASQLQGSTSSFYGFDSQANTRILVSVGGMVTDNYSYKANGEPLQTGSSINPYLFWGLIGGRADMNGLNYDRDRYVSAVIARWLSRDRIGVRRGEWNPYTFVGNNAVTFIDASGFSAKDDALCRQWHGNNPKWHSCSTQWKNCLKKCGNIDNVYHCCSDSMNPNQMDCPCIHPRPVVPVVPMPNCKCPCGGNILPDPQCTCHFGHQIVITPNCNYLCTGGIPDEDENGKYCDYTCFILPHQSKKCPPTKRNTSFAPNAEGYCPDRIWTYFLPLVY